MKQAITLILFSVFFTANLYSAQHNFNNSSGDDMWDNPLNWDLNGIPSTGDLAVIGDQFDVIIPVGYIAKVDGVSVGGELIVLGTLTIIDENFPIVVDPNAQLKISGDLNVTNCIECISGDGSVTVFGGGNLNLQNNGGPGNAISIGALIVKVNGVANVVNFRTGIIIKKSFFNDGVINIIDTSASATSVGLKTQTQSGITPEELDNYGTLNIDGPYTLLQIAFPFNNYGTATLSAEKLNPVIISLNDHDFINEGRLEVTCAVTSSISMDPINKRIFNQECGEIIMENVSVGSQVTNTGFFTSNRGRVGAFTNDGVVIYTGPPGVGSDGYGNYSTHPNSDGLVITEEDGLFEVGVAASDFWLDNSNATMITELFVDINLTISAGQIFANNTWVPSAAAGGEKVFYAQPNLPNCTETIEFTLGSRVKSGDNIWTNDENDELWANPGNWSLNHTPTESEYVIIPAGAKVTLNMIQGLGLHVENSGELKIQSGFKLSIEDSPISGFLNTVTGELIVDGDLQISNSSEEGFKSLSGQSGNKNSGKITLIGNDVGLETRGFLNIGTIDLLNNDTGILLLSNTFSNSGSVIVNGGNDGIFLSTGGTLDNDINGSIDINNVDQVGIRVLGSVQNNGLIDINNTEDEGILVLNDFDNFSGGEVIINNSERNALKLRSQSIVNNSGLFDLRGGEDASDIDENGSIHIVESSTFNNQVCGILEHTEYLEIETGNILTNQGSIISLGSVQHIVPPTIVNEGTIVNNNDSWGGVFFTNNRYVVTPKTTSFAVGDEVNNIFSADSEELPFTSFYSDITLQTPAGYYLPSTGSWTITAQAAGKKRFYFQTESAPCTGIAYFDLPSTVSSPDCGAILWIGGGQGSWSDANSWNLGRTPNACDDVIISGGAQVSMGTSEEINSLQIFGSDLSIVSGKTLTINGYYTNGILIELAGSLNNEGTISFTLPNNGITVNDLNSEFVNEGVVNGSSLLTFLVLLGNASMTNESSGDIFVNEHVDAPQGVSSGIHVECDGCVFDNKGNIILSAFQTGIKIDNLGELNNETTGKVTINSTSEIGVVLSNESVFNNEGLISISNSGQSAMDISLDANFRNLIGSDLIITGTGDDAVFIHDAGILTNRASVEIDEVIGHAVHNQAILENTLSGTFDILSDHSGHGLLQDNSSAKFFNRGNTNIHHANAMDAVKNINSSQILILEGMVKINN